MKMLVMTVLLPVSLLTGCAITQQRAPQPATAPGAAAGQPAADPTKPGDQGDGGSKLLVTPENVLSGKVATYNAAGRFVVLDFPVGHLPALDQRLFVYRQGLKVGEVKVTGPQRDSNTVADLISGEAAKGDEIRDQ